jgi:hypothetical protein
VAVGYTHSVPLSLDQSSTAVFRGDATDFRLSQGFEATWYAVSPGYFGAMGTRLLAGRDFNWQDRFDAPHVAVVNQTFARKVLGVANPVGLYYRSGPGPRGLNEIVGLVEDGKYVSLTEAPRAVVFWPATQQYFSSTSLIVRTSGLDLGMPERMRAAIARLDPDLPIFGVGSLFQVLGTTWLPARAATVSLSAFGLLALMLAVTGIFGLASYSVSRRVREIGIRVALGAESRQVLRLLLGRLAAFIGLGLGVGLAAGVAASQLLASVVYQATPRDPVVWLAVVLAMAFTALFAVLGPARRALSLDPLHALRQE